MTLPIYLSFKLMYNTHRGSMQICWLMKHHNSNHCSFTVNKTDNRLADDFWHLVNQANMLDSDSFQKMISFPNILRN